MATPPIATPGTSTIEAQVAAAAETVSATNVDADEPPAPAESTPHKERLLLLVPRGPLVVDVQIDIDELPQPEAVAELLDKLIAAAGDGDEPTWTKVLASPESASGRFGNVPVSGAKQEQETIRQYDVNRDGSAQRRELVSWLSQGNGSGQAFSVYAVRGFAGQPQEEAPSFALLDQDGDWRISESEMHAAARRLRSRDANDDDVVTLADLRPQEAAEDTSRTRAGVPPRAYALGKLEIDSIWYALGELYGVANGLDADSFGFSPGLFDDLDSDDDGTVDQSEIAALVEARADLSLRVQFGGTADGMSLATLELLATSNDLQQAGVRTSLEPGRLLVELGGMELDISATDVAGSNRRLGDLNAQFAILDKDASGFLDGDELETFSSRARLDIEEIDQDSDGKLSLEEIRDAARGERVFSELQVQARAGATEDSLFDWLDADRDRRLTAREMNSAAARIAELDRDADAALIAPELPECYGCVFLRGRVNTMRGFGPIVGVRRDRSAMPPWLAAMDINGDGEVAPREFVGTPRQFASLDLNGDGFVDASEGNQQADGEAGGGSEPPQN